MALIVRRATRFVHRLAQRVLGHFGKDPPPPSARPMLLCPSITFPILAQLPHFGAFSGEWVSLDFRAFEPCLQGALG